MQATVTVEGGSEPPTTTPPPPGAEPPPPVEGDCVKVEVLDAFMAHVESAHLERSLYVLTHTVWLESVLQARVRRHR